MSNTKETKVQKRLKKMAAKEDDRLESMAKFNVHNMSKLIKILPEELTRHPNQKTTS